MTPSTQTYYPRQLMAQVIFGWLFLVLIYFFSTNSLLTQLHQPVLISPASDNTFWLLHILRIPQWLLQHREAALAFDIILTTSCIICIFVPDQRIFTYITVIGIWILYVCYCTAAGKHYAQIGFLLVPIPFLVLKTEKFGLVWEGVRYWVCLLYTCAGVYKLYYGGFAYPFNMSHILHQMNAEWLFFKPGGIQSDIIRYFIDHPDISQLFYRLAALIEMSLIIGFFTKRVDRLLLIALFVFHLGNFLLLHIPFVEQSLIFAPFFPWKKWAINNITENND